MIFAVKLFSGFLSQFFLYLIPLFLAFIWFGKWIAKTTCQKLGLAVNVQLVLLCHRTPSPIDPSVRTDYRWREGGTLKVRRRDTKHVSCVCLGERQTCGTKPLELLWKGSCCFLFLNNEKLWKQTFLVTSSARGSGTTLTLLWFNFIINMRADT